MQQQAASWPIARVAVEGLLVLRRQPLLLAGWSAFWFVAFGLELSAEYLLLGPVDKLGRLESGAADALSLTLAWAESLKSLPVSAAIYAVGFAAVSRSVLDHRPDDVSYLRLGRSELRIGLSLFVFFAAFTFWPLLIGWILDVEIAWLQSPVSEGPLLRALSMTGMLVGTLFLIIGGTVFALARLWIGPADIIERGRVNLAAVVTIPSGRTGRLFWTFVLALLFSMPPDLFASVLSAVILDPGRPSVAQALSHLFDDDDLRASPFALRTWLQLAIEAPFNAVSWAILMCPAAAIRSMDRRSVVEVF